MSKTLHATSGDVFVRHFFVGFISIAFAIIAIKFFGIFGSSKNAPLITAGFIFVINLIIVGSFTYTIIRNDVLLAEEDSPDHAYYLGFCLTLASLALIFFSDAIANQNTVDLKEKSDLIRGALTQFAAGLLATLLGLNARIYLSSCQNRDKAEPTELLSQLRKDVADFSNELAVSKHEHMLLVSDSIKKLTQSLTKIGKGAESLSLSFENAATGLNESLSISSITEQSKNFLDAITELGSGTRNQSQQFTENLRDLSTNTSALTGDLAKTATQINDINNSISVFSEHLLRVSNNDLPQVSASTKILISGLDGANSAIGGSANLVTDQMKLLNLSIEASKQTFDDMSAEFNTIKISHLKEDIAVLSRDVEKLSGIISNLSSRVNDAANNFQHLSVNSQGLSTSLERLNLSSSNTGTTTHPQHMNEINKNEPNPTKSWFR